MSFISSIDKDSAVIYLRRIPVTFREELVRRGYKFVEVPDKEHVTFGSNVLTVALRVVIIPSGNPGTKDALKKAVSEACERPADYIAHKGRGGPACLTSAPERE